MELGTKIKNLRKKHNMTQSALAGDRITRNMLSKIENGEALPSLETLFYIAERLGVTAGFLISAEEDSFAFEKAACQRELKIAMRNGKYQEYVNIWKKKLGRYDDEIAFGLAYAYYRIGAAYTYSGAMNSAEEALMTSLEYSEKTVYKTDFIRAGCILLLSISRNVQAPLLEFESDKFADLIDDSVNYELYRYLVDDASYGYSFKPYGEHLRAKELMRARQWRRALNILFELEKDKGTSGISAYLIFRIYSDIEICTRELGDFENAYKFSNKRIAMLSAFKS